ncbi:hypothetical protein GCM10023176_61760 [Micromonospora coerulea]|uniref:Uncharacterized protein n=1 Tax=Micromonospora coerulea TaxID=47856 RepID=A0ABP8T409_9ACTN
MPQEVYELLAAVFGASPVWLAAVGSVVVHAQVPSVPVFHRRRDLVQAGSPHNSLPASRDDLTVAWPAAKQHVHPLEVMWLPGGSVQNERSPPAAGTAARMSGLIGSGPCRVQEAAGPRAVSSARRPVVGGLR